MSSTSSRLSSPDAFPQPSPHMDRYPMLPCTKSRESSRSTRRVTESSTSSSKKSKKQWSLEDFLMEENEKALGHMIQHGRERLSKSSLANNAMAAVFTAFSPIDGIINDMRLMSDTMPNYKSRFSQSISRSISPVDDEIQQIRNTTLSSSLDDPRDTMLVDEVVRRRPKINRNQLNITPQCIDRIYRHREPVYFTVMRSATEVDLARAAEESIKSRLHRLRIYDDSASANTQPQTPADLRKHKSRMHNRSTPVLHCTQQVHMPAKPQRNTYPQHSASSYEFEQIAENIDNDDCVHFSPARQSSGANSLEVEFDYPPEPDAHRGIHWMRRNASANLNIISQTIDGLDRGYF